MASVDTPEAKPKPGGRKKRRRASIRIDMTPMVDIAFLLLIFFMVTTVFRKPQAMEMNLPPKDVTVKVPESNVLQLYIDQTNRAFYRFAKDPLTPADIKALVPFFKQQATANSNLIVLVKMDRAAQYETMVNVLDDLEFANMKRFSMIPMKQEDLDLVMAQP